MTGFVASADYVPGLVWVTPFVALLLAIALLPLIPATRHWWEHNRNKLLVGIVLAVMTLAYYGLRATGLKLEGAEPADAHATTTGTSHAAEPVFEPAPPPVIVRSAPGWPTVTAVLDHAVLGEYVPFIVLLLCLYVILGGIVVRGDLRATPAANTLLLGIGSVLASFIGTTGAAMVLIRPVLKMNSERKHVAHTVVFFIFLVANIGGALLPVGDPPLFLGYLRGVPFFWTLRLVQEWAVATAIVLTIYYLWDRRAYATEARADIRQDVEESTPISLGGAINVWWLLGVVAAVIVFVPGRTLPGLGVVPPYLREAAQLACMALSLLTTPRGVRQENSFNFTAIGEVAALFIGIFITMQVPIEILHARGAELGLARPWQFFWATGALSSFLDNAPTYVVFFETAVSLPNTGGPHVLTLLDGRNLPMDLLAAISCGAVFMGANTYIGNGPNFMVKSIAEQAGVKMPSFFGYTLYSGAILVPVFILLTFIFFWM